MLWKDFVSLKHQEWTALMARTRILLNSLQPFEVEFHRTAVRPLVTFTDSLASVSPLPTGTGAASSNSNSNNHADSLLQSGSIRLCGESVHSFHLCTDDVVRQAEAIFTSLFPEKEFLSTAEPADEIAAEGDNTTGVEDDPSVENSGSVVDRGGLKAAIVEDEETEVFKAILKDTIKNSAKRRDGDDQGALSATPSAATSDCVHASDTLGDTLSTSAGSIVDATNADSSLSNEPREA
jgi:hypothetical protein